MCNDNSIERLIGKQIQAVRKKKGYTQQQLSEMVGLSTNYLSDVERGKSSIRLDKLVAIINALGCTADDIFTDVIESRYKIKGSRLSEKIKDMPPSDQEKVYAIVDAIIEQLKK